MLCDQYKTDFCSLDLLQQISVWVSYDFKIQRQQDIKIYNNRCNKQDKWDLFLTLLTLRIYQTSFQFECFSDRFDLGNSEK